VLIIVVDYTVKDAEKLGHYAAAVPQTLQGFDGEVLVRGAINVLVGELQQETRVILRFADKATALAWYQSDDYQALVELRNQGMDSQFSLVS